MYSDMATVINQIQASNMKANKAFVCKAVQEYYKQLLATKAIRQVNPDLLSRVFRNRTKE